MIIKFTEVYSAQLYVYAAFIPFR